MNNKIDEVSLTVYAHGGTMRYDMNHGTDSDSFDIGKRLIVFLTHEERRQWAEVLLDGLEEIDV